MDATREWAERLEMAEPDSAGAMEQVTACRDLVKRPLRVLIEVPVARVWHARLQARLQARGHSVCLTARNRPASLGPAVLLALERLLYGARSVLFDAAPPPHPDWNDGSADLVVRLDAGFEPEADIADDRALSVRFDGVPGEAAMIRAVLAGGAPVVCVTRDCDQPSGPASPDVLSSGLPALEDGAVLARALDHILARVEVLVAQAVDRVATCGEQGLTQAAEPSRIDPAPGERREAGHGSVAAFFTRSLARKMRQRFARSGADHWHSSWRFASGAGPVTLAQPDRRYVALQDDDTAYYADPFPFDIGGRSYVFCEKFPYATGKGHIVVFEIGDDGSVSAPRPVLEHAAHLSYPQVFARDGAIFMLPEMSAAGRIEVFRALDFPDRWVPHAVLVDHVVAADTTLVEHEDRLWLFTALSGDGGSSWDQLALFHARTLEGPWEAHPGNPVLIDAGCARPAGSLWTADGALWRVAQDCRAGYGSGLSICRVDRLDPTGYAQTLVRRFGPPRSLGSTGVHTMNRSARLEVFDWRAPRSA